MRAWTRSSGERRVGGCDARIVSNRVEPDGRRCAVRRGAAKHAFSPKTPKTCRVISSLPASLASGKGSLPVLSPSRDLEKADEACLRTRAASFSRTRASVEPARIAEKGAFAATHLFARAYCAGSFRGERRLSVVFRSQRRSRGRARRFQQARRAEDAAGDAPPRGRASRDRAGRAASPTPRGGFEPARVPGPSPGAVSRASPRPTTSPTRRGTPSLSRRA